MKTVLASAAVVLLFIVNACTQKLPRKQKVSLRTPSNFKIDGRSIEWGDKFQAYNKATNVFYTMANDDDNLYLIVQATDPGIANKLGGGGVTLTVITSGNKKDKNGIAVTFPARETRNLPFILRHQEILELLRDTGKNRGQIDSVSKVYNKKIADNIKYIAVTGIKEIPDNLISIYNDTGIKTAAQFDSRIHYTYELAVPLKYLGLTININKQAKFIYQIKLNGTTPANATTFVSGSGRFIIVQEPGKEPTATPNIPLYSASVYPTDFWGEYTLAKK